MASIAKEPAREFSRSTSCQVAPTDCLTESSLSSVHRSVIAPILKYGAVEGFWNENGKQ